MALHNLQPGDTVYSNTAVYNDGGIPDIAPDALIAEAGARGVIINIGYLEDNPDKEIFLVRFEQADLALGPPVGCWPAELSDAPVQMD